MQQRLQRQKDKQNMLKFICLSNIRIDCDLVNWAELDNFAILYC